MAVCSPTVFSPLALKLTKVGGRAKQTHIAVPASPSRRVVIFACGRAAAAPALFHNLGDDGKGDLLRRDGADVEAGGRARSEEHTSELQSLMRISYAVFCLKKKKDYRRNQQTKKR